MKELNMSWDEIKSTPRVQLDGLLLALQNYTTMHAFDGYNDKDINEMAKNKPEVTSQYSESKRVKRKFELRAGIQKVEKYQSLSEALK
tara:strand:- start:316 stop:579 length:264 start_codon:yes stop_codon:yes gene_type:complete